MAPRLHVMQNIDDLSLPSLPKSMATTTPETFIQMHGSLFKTRVLVLQPREAMITNLTLRRCLNLKNFIKKPTDLPRCVEAMNLIALDDVVVFCQ